MMECCAGDTCVGVGDGGDGVGDVYCGGAVESLSKFRDVGVLEEETPARAILHHFSWMMVGEPVFLLDKAVNFVGFALFGRGGD